MSFSQPGWAILVPVKATDRGKSRLDLPPSVRRSLALAMALDTMSAAAQCGTVIAVLEDERDAARISSIPEVRAHRTSVTGLNESVLDALKALAGSGVSKFTTRVAVLPGDLPGLRSDELAAALDQCARHRFSVVADHQGVGTTLLAATVPSALRPQYGPDSFRRHRESGAVAIALPSTSSLRFDVDTVDDLGVAAGPFTTAARNTLSGRLRDG